MWSFWFVDEVIELIFVGCVKVLFLEMRFVVVYCIIIVLFCNFGFGLRNVGKLLFNWGFISCFKWCFDMFVNLFIFNLRWSNVKVIGCLWKLLFEIINVLFVFLNISGLLLVVFILNFNCCLI